MKTNSSYKWHNWFENQRCTATLYEPETRDELIRAIMTAAKTGLPMRPVGGSYAWSPLIAIPVVTGNLIRLQKLTRLLEVNRTARTLRVETGMTIGELFRIAAESGMTLRSPPIFPDVSVGGAISVAAHGSGQRHSTMSDYITELEIIRADGVALTLCPPDPDFAAACCSLGTMGFIYSVTLQCDPEFNVEIDKGRRSLKATIDSLEDLRASHEFLELYWFVPGDTAWVELMNRTDAPPDHATPWERLIGNLVSGIEGAASGFLPVLVRLWPSSVTPLLKVYHALVRPFAADIDTRYDLAPAGMVAEDDLRGDGPDPGLSSDEPAAVVAKRGRFDGLLDAAQMLLDPNRIDVQTASDAFHYIRAYPKSWDVEISVPAAQAAAAWVFIDRAIAAGTDERTGLPPVNLAVHLRFVKASALPLSPAFGRDSCYIEFVTTRAPGDEAFIRTLLHDLMTEFAQARPHWGKYVSDDPRDIQMLRGRYPMNAFAAIQKRFDPHGLLLNPFLRELLFPAAQGQPAAIPIAPPPVAAPAAV